MPEKTTAEIREVSLVCEMQKNHQGKDLWKRWVLSLERKRGVMDDDSGDEGNDELTCVRSDESDKTSW